MLRFRYLPFLFLPALLCGQQLTFATYQGGSGTESTAGVAQDSLGNVYLAGATTSTNFPVASAAGGGFVIKLSATGTQLTGTQLTGTQLTGSQLAATLLPGANVAITAIAVDTSVSPNTVVVAGTMPAGALTSTAGAYSTPNGTGFVAKLNSTLTQTLWTSTFSANPAALAVDSAGNIYTAGSAQAGFVTTTGAVQPANPGPTGTYNAFVLKLSSSGTTAIYATFLGGSTYDAASAIAVDSTGEAYLTGTTASSDFPQVNSQQKFGGALPYYDDWYGDAFVAKIDPQGATLLYSTYLGGVAADAGNAIAVDANGNAYVAGGTESANWLVGAATGTFQTTYAGPTPDPSDPDSEGDAFVAKFSPSGTLDWYTYLGGSGYDEATAIALDASGNIYFAGNTGSTDFPQAGNPVPDCHIGEHPFLAEFNPAGAKLLLTTGLSGMGYDLVSAMAFDTVHNVAYLAGDVESVVFFSTPGATQPNYGGGEDDSFVSRLDLTVQPVLEVSCVLNGASFMAGNTSPYPTGTVAPGEIVSLFGVGLGPTPYAPLQLTASGTVATSIGGMTVKFDGLPAPLLYAGSGQINAVVPYGIDPSTTNMTVESSTLSVGPIPMPVATTVPAIFNANDPLNPTEAAATNSDGTYNSIANPATRGTYITFYVCGAGMMSNSSDGAVTPSTQPFPMPLLQPVTVTIRGVNAQVLYAGAAPGYVSGLLQINVIVPTTIDFGNHVPLVVTIGNYTGQDNVTIAIQ